MATTTASAEAAGAPRNAAKPFDLLAALPHSKGSAVPDKWLKALAADKWQERKQAAEPLE